MARRAEGLHSRPNEPATGRSARGDGSPQLRDRGLRTTPSRLMVFGLLDAAARTGRCLGAKELYVSALQIDHRMAFSTLYRALVDLEHVGLAQRMACGEQRSVYTLTRASPDGHMVNSETGEIVEFRDEPLTQQLRSVARHNGFELVRHTLTIYVRNRVLA